MSPLEFSRKLLKLWGGKLVEVKPVEVASSSPKNGKPGEAESTQTAEVAPSEPIEMPSEPQAEATQNPEMAPAEPSEMQSEPQAEASQTAEMAPSEPIEMPSEPKEPPSEPQVPPSEPSQSEVSLTRAPSIGEISYKLKLEQALPELTASEKAPSVLDGLEENGPSTDMQHS
jgi:hypothetical protein